MGLDLDYAVNVISIPMHKRLSNTRIVILGLVAVTAAAPAFAYLDPNSAGLLYQIFFPLIIAATIAWRRIKDIAFLIWMRIRRIRD
jgi:hypothetical protein